MKRYFQLIYLLFIDKEYIPFIINEEFIKSKKRNQILPFLIILDYHLYLSDLKKITKQSNKKLAADFRLYSIFIQFKKFRFKDDKISLKYFF